MNREVVDINDNKDYRSDSEHKTVVKYSHSKEKIISLKINIDMDVNPNCNNVCDDNPGNNLQSHVKSRSEER